MSDYDDEDIYNVSNNMLAKHFASLRGVIVIIVKRKLGK